MTESSLARTLGKPWRALRFWQHGSGATNPDTDDELLQGIVETTPACIQVIARDGSVIHMNLAGLKMIEAESMENRSWFSLHRKTGRSGKRTMSASAPERS